ncbi:predicted protein [Postia placenta Mad-698-R]|uniref:Uncharacterized protein n=1 Tax=Postia placenta MAD-698-R-SB12 TaxID=670580 RepID=A0A1X6MIW9_9APHY|nr:hypothetical protein POSPLADRAFT_1050804 [Postia placenta MAD-698-R-SB12]EED83671.1 predicted protein [Postia placenta Mad-698-R]OSX56285.1 hypothetical protein POSPLADRAFT_1050804 [Postia placenta MAD-698-R-SB12]
MSQPNHDFLAPAEYGLLADFSPWPSPADFSVTLPVQNTGSSFIEGNHAAEMALPVYYSPYDSSQAATSPLNPVPTNSVATWQPQVERNSSQSTPVTPLRRLRVPQTIQASQNSRPFYSVEFQVGGSCGVRIRDVLKERVRVDRSAERVFDSVGVRQFRLVIAWPGYSNSGTYIPVQSNGGYINRGRLATLICLHIARFMNRASAREWTIGRRGIKVENVWLLSVSPALSNIWLAEIEVQL